MIVAVLSLPSRTQNVRACPSDEVSAYQGGALAVLSTCVLNVGDEVDCWFGARATPSDVPRVLDSERTKQLHRCGSK